MNATAAVTADAPGVSKEIDHVRHERIRLWE
jgi:hypothetical protein